MEELNWSDPVINEKQSLQFPIGSVPHYLADLCKAIALEVQVPIELPFFASLSVIAAATTGKIEIALKGRHIEQLSLYTLIGLGSGNRKSEVIRTLRLPLVKIESDLIAEAKPNRSSQIAERKAYEHALEAAQAKARKGITATLMAEIHAATEKLDKCKVTPLPKIFADNVTPEKHAAIIAEQGSSSIIEPEGGFFEGLSRYGNNKAAQVDYLNKSFGGESFRVDRQGGDSIIAENPHCVLHFSIQPHIVHAIKSNPDFMGTGFANRFLYCLPQSLIGLRRFDTPPVQKAMLDSWDMRIDGVFSNSYGKPKRQLSIDPAGLQSLQEYSEQLEPDLLTKYGQIEGWASKLPGAIVRIAALYELAANPSAIVVSSENIKAALALAPFLLEHALQALSAPAQEQPQHKLLVYLVEKQEATQAQQSGSVGSVGAIPSYQTTTRQLQQQFGKSSWLAHSDQQAAMLRGLLVELAKDHWLQLVPVQSTAQGGRPAELWAVNPKAPEIYRRL